MSVRRGERWIMNARANPPPAIVLVEVHDRRPDGHANGAQIVREPRHQIAGARPRDRMLRRPLPAV